VLAGARSIRCGSGCLIGARGRLPLDPLIRLGFFYGAAFQIQDDLLNLAAGSAYGKEINGDLRKASAR
jgi:geranylgeranyl diphosphate synthase type II